MNNGTFYAVRLVYYGTLNTDAWYSMWKDCGVVQLM